MPSSHHKSFIKTEVSVLLSHKCWHCKPEQVSQFNNCPSSENLLTLPPNSVNSRSSFQYFHSLYNSGHKQIQTQAKLITYNKSLFALANLYFFFVLELDLHLYVNSSGHFSILYKTVQRTSGDKISYQVSPSKTSIWRPIKAFHHWSMDQSLSVSHKSLLPFRALVFPAALTH